jgi:hypothetical protein
MADPELERVRTLARVLDNYYLDPLIGFFIPGGGDIIGAVLGMYTVGLAIKRGVSPVIIARMLMNLTIDAVIGFIPLVGDVFDVVSKANVKNAELLAQRSEGRARARDWLLVVGAGFVFFAVIGLVIWGMISLFRAIV